MGGRTIRKLRDKDLIGVAVRLARDVKTFGGILHKAGWVYRVDTTWRGRFSLFRINSNTGEPMMNAGMYRFLVRGIRRSAFHMLPARETPTTPGYHRIEVARGPSTLTVGKPKR